MAPMLEVGGRETGELRGRRGGLERHLRLSRAVSSITGPGAPLVFKTHLKAEGSSPQYPPPTASPSASTQVPGAEYSLCFCPPGAAQASHTYPLPQGHSSKGVGGRGSSMGQKSHWSLVVSPKGGGDIGARNLAPDQPEMNFKKLQGVGGGNFSETVARNPLRKSWQFTVIHAEGRFSRRAPSEHKTASRWETLSREALGRETGFLPMLSH